MNKKIYAVELSTVIMVFADNQDAALTVAEENIREAVRDNDLEATWAEEVTGQDQLSSYGWGREFSPYGGNGTMLRDLLPLTTPDKDTKTIDLFEA